MSRTLHTAWVALGSNLPSPTGAPAETVYSAIAALGELGAVTAQSSLYETAPVGYQAQPAFINAVVALSTALSPQALLDALLAIEQRFGRDRAAGPPKGPRTLDLDLLFFDQLVLNTPALTLPHPAIADRRFVLEPLAEIAPGLRHPLLGLTVGDLLKRLRGEGEVRRLASSPSREG